MKTLNVKELKGFKGLQAVFYKNFLDFRGRENYKKELKKGVKD
jgi:hypothetical protein